MGYSSATVEKGFHLYSVSFKEVGDTKGLYDINNIKVFQNGSELSENNVVTMQKITDDGKGDYSSTLYKYRADKGGWTNGKTLQTGITLKNGEAVCINNILEASVELRSSGEVDLSPVSAEIGAGFSLYGNMSPTTIDINSMKVYVGNAELQENNVVTIQKMNEDGKGDYSATLYKYRADKGGWTNGKTLQTGVTLAPGEAFCINNISGKIITLRFPNPLENDK